MQHVSSWKTVRTWALKVMQSFDTLPQELLASVTFAQNVLFKTRRISTKNHSRVFFTSEHWKKWQPCRWGGCVQGAALALARRRKERTYPELLRSERCRLVVLAVEVGGRWSDEGASFVRALARATAREVPVRLRSSLVAVLVARWSALLSQLCRPLLPPSRADGALPPLGELLADAGEAPLTAGRLPAG